MVLSFDLSHKPTQRAADGYGQWHVDHCIASRGIPPVGDRMTHMLQVVVTVIGLLGSGAAGVVISALIQRRDCRQSIRSDLDIWAKLPSGPTKDKLLASIERRVTDLIDMLQRSFITARYVAIVSWMGGLAAEIIFDVIAQIGGSYSWRRHSDGILWLHTLNGPSNTFQSFVLITFAGPVATVVLFYVVNAFLNTELPALENRLRRKRAVDSDDQRFLRPG